MRLLGAALVMFAVACATGVPDAPELVGADDRETGSDTSGSRGTGGSTGTYTIGGTVTGLVGTGLVLDNGGDQIAIARNGTFAFATRLAPGAAFNVSVRTQPQAPQQTCVVSAGAGTMSKGNVASVLVNCSSGKFAISGTVTGLEGTGLTLRNNGGETIAVNTSSFAFPTPLDDLAPYAVTVDTQPTSKWQTCTASNERGRVAGAPVTGISVRCTTNQYRVRVTVSGLDGTGLVLQNNGGNDLAIPSNGTFEFTQPVASGAFYDVTTRTNPTNKRQSCVVAGGAAGTMQGADVAVSVNCSTNADNVVLNPGFETPNANWQCLGPCGFDTGGVFARTGAGNGWVRNDTGWNAIQQTVTVTSNRTYQVSAWIRTSANNAEGYFGIRTPLGVILAERKFGSLAGYTLLSVTVNSGSATRLVVYGGLWASGDTYLQIDDVVVGEQ